MFVFRTVLILLTLKDHDTAEKLCRKFGDPDKIDTNPVQIDILFRNGY